MAEVIVLDPVEVSGRNQLDISLYVRAEGADWGDSEITAFMAEMSRGSTAVDYRIPNRNITLPLVLRTRGQTSYATIRSNLQRKVARIQQEGGWLKRTTGSSTLFISVVNASLSLGGSWMQSRTNDPVDIEGELHLECIPDWYGAEITLPLRTATNQSELIFTETGILGDWPGRVRVLVDELEGQAQQGLLWGIRSRHFSNSTTAQLKYQATSCTPLDSAVSGSAFGATAIIHTSLSTNWTPVLSTAQTGNVHLTHTGTYRVWARAYSLSGAQAAGTTSVRARFLWDVGDFSIPTENTAVQVPMMGAYSLVDLGEVRLDRVPSGAHRWQGIVQAAGAGGGEQFGIERIWFQPVDEGVGKLTAPTTLDPGLNTFAARDEFNQTGGALTGKSLPAGGVWQGAGDTDDFVMQTTEHNAVRQATGDSAVDNGRFATAGTAQYNTAIVVQVDFRRLTSTGQQIWSGVLARWSATNTWLFAGISGVTGSSTVPNIEGRSAGATVVSSVGSPMSIQTGKWYTARLSVDTAGRFLLWVFPQGGSPGNPVVSGQSSVLATGGALQTGRIGFYDSNIFVPPIGVAAAVTRNYDNFVAWVPQQDAVLFPSRHAEFRTEGMFREDPTGTAYGPVTLVEGDLPRIPPSGSEGRTCQVFLKHTRGDFGALPDPSVTDDLSARLIYRPSYMLTS